MVEESRAAIEQYTNAVIVATNQRLGRPIDTEVLVRGPAEYGKQILATPSQELAWSHISGFLPLKSDEASAFCAAEVAAKYLGC